MVSKIKNKEKGSIKKIKTIANKTQRTSYKDNIEITQPCKVPSDITLFSNTGGCEGAQC